MRDILEIFVEAQQLGVESYKRSGLQIVNRAQDNEAHALRMRHARRLRPDTEAQRDRRAGRRAMLAAAHEASCA